MKLPQVRLSRTQVFSYSLFVLSALILVASFMLTMNITVLKDWKLSVPAAEIHAGDTVTLVSEYTKVRDVTGRSIRYIECQNQQHIYIRYPLNEAVANRGSGTAGTGVVVKVPDSIPYLPTTCKFTIAIEYDVYPWRKVDISNSTNEFTLLPRREVPQAVSLNVPSSAQINQGQALAPASGQNEQAFSSSSNNTPYQPPPQSNTSQVATKPDGSPVPPNPQPVDNRTTLDRLPVVGGLFNSIGL